MLLPTNFTHSGKPSNIPLPTKPSYTLPAQTHTFWPCIDRKITVPTIKDFHIPLKTDNHPLHEESGSIYEPLTPEMRAKVATMLKQDYIGSVNCANGMQVKTHWLTEYGEDIGMFRLKRSITPTQVIGYRTLRNFLNKPTALYWAHSAQERDSCRLFPFACIYKEWFRYYDNDPDFSFGHFFANPIQVTSTGPTTIADICEAHTSLCDRASSRLDMVRRGEAGKAHVDDWPSPQNYNLLPLCRAVLIVLDKISPNPGARISLEKEVQRQDVLIIRIRDEDGLSAPINFDAIRPQSLPLTRSDINSDDSDDILRVSLRTAVHFILDLQRREETAFPDLRCNASDRSTRADNRVAEILRKVDEKGSNNVSEMNFVIETIEARERGEPSYEAEFDLWSPMWN